ncbi:hypothetical protein [Desulfogranum mediterraneum]|uniref:hypothetical protein n=1 Tax=Desulfogranum mediterraneum TaxID=160661 RepID=UPI0003F9EA4D|nr:hypothetical protein [Desulfogranum mediterraneum]
MIQHLKGILLLGTASLLLLPACSQKQAQESVSRDPKVVLNCIGVLPVQTAVDYDDSLSIAQSKQLKEGATLLDSLLERAFAGRRDVRFVTSSQLYGLKNSSEADGPVGVKLVAEQLSCNGMMEVIISRYHDRVGGDYTAKTPASVAFDYRLYEVESGQVLCHGSFDEVQQTFMENLYNWKRARSPGFTWITGEQLLKEGLEEKIDQCPYLQAP